MPLSSCLRLDFNFFSLVFNISIFQQLVRHGKITHNRNEMREIWFITMERQMLMTVAYDLYQVLWREENHLKVNKWHWLSRDEWMRTCRLCYKVKIIYKSFMWTLKMNMLFLEHVMMDFMRQKPNLAMDNKFDMYLIS